MKIFDNITKTVGRTPLVRLNRLAPEGARVLVKLESFNPLGSIKDRAAVSMVDEAERSGALKPGGTLVEATSGNTGVGLAMVAAARGYRLIVTMPDNMSVERRKLLAALGSEVELTPGREGMRGAVDRAEKIVSSIPGAVLVRQFDNPANPAVHEAVTAEEIWTDTEGQVEIVVAGVGTGGTVTGVGRGLKAKNPAVRVVAVEPKGSAVLSGGPAGPHKIAGIGAGFVPTVFDRGAIDEVVAVSDDDAGHMTRSLARQEGILAGISSGAAVVAALELAGRPENRGKLIVAILNDSGERYLSTWLFEIPDSIHTT